MAVAAQPSPLLTRDDLLELRDALLMLRFAPKLRVLKMPVYQPTRLVAAVRAVVPHLEIPMDAELADSGATPYDAYTVCARLVFAGTAVDVVLSELSARVLRVSVESGPPIPLARMTFDSEPVELGNGERFDGRAMPSYKLFVCSPMGSDLRPDWSKWRNDEQWRALPLDGVPHHPERTYVMAPMGDDIGGGYALYGIDTVTKVVVQCRLGYVSGMFGMPRRGLEGSGHSVRHSVPHLDADNARLVWSDGERPLTIAKRVVAYTGATFGPDAADAWQLAGGILAENHALSVTEERTLAPIVEIVEGMDRQIDGCIRMWAVRRAE
jgi:hypothetical protein